jgi:hypothetical protein
LLIGSMPASFDSRSPKVLALSARLTTP